MVKKRSEKARLGLACSYRASAKGHGELLLNIPFPIEATFSSGAPQGVDA
jgi:hypothetical protein